MAENKQNKRPNVPPLRFPEFTEPWERDRIRNLFNINVGGDIDKKNVSPTLTDEYKYPIIANALSNHGIYGYTLTFKDSAPCITVTGRGEVGVAKFRDYPLYPIVRLLVLHSNGIIDCQFGEHAINAIKKYEESTGVPQLTAPQLGAYSIKYPSFDEQVKIGKFFASLDRRIAVQSKLIEQLESLIEGITLQASKSSDCESVLLSEILTERNEANTAQHEVFSVSVSQGVVNQVEYLGRSFAAKDISHYNVVHYGDIIYTKSPTGDFPYGIVKRSHQENPVAVSPLYGVYIPASNDIGCFLHYYFCNAVSAKNYLHKLIQKGAKNTINITNQRFLENTVNLPKADKLAQVVALLNCLSKKKQQSENLLVLLNKQKQFFLNQMFI